jgi:hypothetical protein
MAVNILIPTALQLCGGSVQWRSGQHRWRRPRRADRQIPRSEKPSIAKKDNCDTSSTSSTTNIRYAEKGATPIKDGDALSIVPSIAAASP